MKVRTRFSKRDEVKFISHLDLMNTLTRALRRARIPIKFSQGYNPRPLISFGSALAVGITSFGEYADFELDPEYSAGEFKRNLNRELPIGVRILQATEISSESKSLMSQINTARYEIDLKFEQRVDQQQVSEILREFLATDTIMIVRKRRNKSDREFDLRPMVYELSCLGIINKQRAVIEALIQTGSSGNLRPGELIRALRQRYPISKEVNLTDVHRSGLYVKEDNKLLTPFEIALK